MEDPIPASGITIGTQYLFGLLAKRTTEHGKTDKQIQGLFYPGLIHSCSSKDREVPLMIKIVIRPGR